MQNSREVIDNLLRNRPADRVGLNDSPWGDTLEKWVTQGYPADDEGKPVDAGEHFGFDIAGAGGWLTWEPKLDAGETIEETDEWRITRNGAGAVLKWWKHRSGTPEHIDFAMTSREVWESEYKPLLIETDIRKRVGLDGVKENIAKYHEQGLWVQYGSQFIWENMRASMGDYTMYMSLIDDPDWIHDFNRTYTDLFKAGYKLLFEEAGLPDGFWFYEDMGYKDSLFCSPKVLEELIFPYYAEMVEFMHSYDLPVVLHTCGYTEPALDMIVQAGFDGLNPMEVKAGNDPFRIADRYADKLVLIGGLDARVFESGDRDVIGTRVADYIEGMKSRGVRLVFGSDHSLSTNIDYEDFKYAIEVFREHMMY